MCKIGNKEIPVHFAPETTNKALTDVIYASEEVFLHPMTQRIVKAQTVKHQMKFEV